MLIKKNKIPFLKIILIGFLPSFLKKMIYRSKGYKIGKGVQFSPGSVIIGNNVSIGDFSKFGFISVVRGKNIEIDRFVTIGSLSMIDTETIIIGEDSRINENVIVGGIKNADSMLKLGKRVIIMEYSFINPTKPIIIGDDSGIGGHCLLFTHGSWLSQLDGFPVTFAPITLGNKVWLPWRVFIMPGVTIGDEVVIGANSLISNSLPSNVLAAGSPAKIIKEDYPKKISSEKRNETLHSIFSEFISYLIYNDIKVIKEENETGFVMEVISKKKRQVVLFVNEHYQGVKNENNAQLLVIDSPVVPTIDAEMILNLNQKTRKGTSAVGEELAKYFSRYGVRFDRLD